MRRSLLLALMLLVASPSFAATVADVTMPDSMQVNGKNLVLNGMGLRRKIVKVYVAGLYLPAKETSAEKILSSDTERNVTMQFVRDVEKASICNAWHEGLKNNTPSKASALKGDFDTLCNYMADMKVGNKMSFTYVPGQGTTVAIDGANKGTIAGKDFADAMFGCWIGPNPPGADFKKGLLGG
ncbi:MAG TPA: chalcone isomerase family protein [bacterium]|nr:chalcone isomerase family protein [bacterium]